MLHNVHVLVVYQYGMLGQCRLVISVYLFWERVDHGSRADVSARYWPRSADVRTA
jgi:hypothetical protein